MKTPTINSRILKLEVLKGTATRASVNAVESRTTSLEGDVATAQGDISTLQTDVSAAEGNISTLQGDVATITQGIQDAVSTHNTAPDAHADLRTLVAGKQDSLTISDVGEAMLALATPIGQKIPRVNADGSVVLINVPSGDGVGGSSWYASDDGPPSVVISLSWVSDGDTNGVFRALGTESGAWSNPASSGRIRSLASAIFDGAVGMLTDRTTTNTVTNNVANSWFAFDLGVGTTIALDSYSLQGRGPDPTSQLRTWVIQGSNDVPDWTSAGISAATWTTIDSRAGDSTISGAGVWGHWTVSVRSAPYRFIRIMQTGVNSDGVNYLCLSEVELYGIVPAPVVKPEGATGWARNSELIDDATAWMPYYATSALTDGTPIFGTAYDVASAVSAHNVAGDSHADIRTALAGKQDAGSYAGSSTPGGAATTALACTGNAATATTAASCTGNSATSTTASSCSGNAATATKLATARTLTIGSKTNTFDGSADKAWTLAEIGAASTTALTTEATTRASSDNALWAALYAEQTGGTTCEIPLAATGDGSGVLTLRLWSDVANTATLSNGAFYGEIGGTTNLGQSVAMTAGQFTTFYIKLPSGSTATMSVLYGWALTRWGQSGTEFVVEATNAPKLNGLNTKYIPQNVTTIRLNSNLGTSIVTGSTRAWTSATYILFSGSSIAISGTTYPWTSATIIYFSGSSIAISGTTYPWTSATNIQFIGNSMTLTANLSTSFLTTGNLYLFISGTGIAVTYTTTRIWPTTMRGMYLRPSVGSMPTADTDRLFIDVDATCTTASTEKVLDARGNCGAVTAASSAARTSLVAKGFTVSYNS